MADNLDGEEIGVGTAEEPAEAGDLAGGAAVEDGAAGAERGAGLAEGVARVALDIFGAAHGGEAGFVLRRDMDGDKGGGLENDAEDKAALGKRVAGEFGEDAAGGAGQAQGMVSGAGGEAIGREVGRAGVKHGAGAFAGAAPHATGGLDGGAQKALGVGDHDNGITRAGRTASRAAGAGLRHGQAGTRRVPVRPSAAALPRLDADLCHNGAQYSITVATFAHNAARGKSTPPGPRMRPEDAKDTKTQKRGLFSRLAFGIMCAFCQLSSAR